MGPEISFENLSESDLYVDCVYKGGNKIKYTVREHAFENQDLYDTDYDDDKLTVINKLFLYEKKYDKNILSILPPSSG